LIDITRMIAIIQIGQIKVHRGIGSSEGRLLPHMYVIVIITVTMNRPILAHLILIMVTMLVKHNVIQHPAALRDRLDCRV